MDIIKCGDCPRVEYHGRTYIWCPVLQDWRLAEQQCEAEEVLPTLGTGLVDEPGEAG